LSNDLRLEARAFSGNIWKKGSSESVSFPTIAILYDLSLRYASSKGLTPRAQLFLGRIDGIETLHHKLHGFHEPRWIAFSQLESGMGVSIT
jgi:hypothetical protein